MRRTALPAETWGSTPPQLPAGYTDFSSHPQRTSTLRRQRLNDLQGDRRQRILNQWLHDRDETDEQILAEHSAEVARSPRATARPAPLAVPPDSNSVWRPEINNRRRLDPDVAVHRQVAENILTMSLAPSLPPSRTPSRNRSAPDSKPPSHRSDSPSPDQVWFTMGEGEPSKAGEAMLYHLDRDTFSRAAHIPQPYHVPDWPSAVEGYSDCGDHMDFSSVRL